MHQAGKLKRRHHGDDRGNEHGRHLAGGKGGDDQADSRRGNDVDKGAGQERQGTALDRHLKHDIRHRGQEEKADHADDHVGQLFAEQKFKPGRRRDVEIGDRAQFLFLDDAHRHQNRRNEYQQHGRHAGHHGIDALEGRVVSKPLFDKHRPC